MVRSTRSTHLRALSGLLSTDHRDDSAQLSTLRRMLFDDLLVHTTGLGEVCSGLEHTILQLQHLLECVVKERSRECYRVLRVLPKAHLELAWAALLFGRLGSSLLVRLAWLLSGEKISASVLYPGSRGQRDNTPLDKCDALCHLGDSVSNTVCHDGVCRRDTAAWVVAGYGVCLIGHWRGLLLC